MQPNIFFLILGLILSVTSKLLQFVFKEEIDLGNIIVIPAAVCFCLAILFTIPGYSKLFSTETSRLQAIGLALLACGAVVLFQIMMIRVISEQVLWPLLLIIPILLCAGLFTYLWLRVM